MGTRGLRRAMRNIRRSARESTTGDRVFIAAIVLSLVGIGGIYYATTSREAPPSTGSTYTPRPLNPEAEPDPITSVKVRDVMPRLADPSRPFTVALIGDSTGVDTKGWQMRVMDWLSVETNRPWEMRQWHADEAYGPPGYWPDPWKYGGGVNAPITLWNASAGGKSFDYTAEHLDKMFPKSLQSVDLILVNHGHNVDPPSQYFTTGIPTIEKLVKRFPKSAVLVMAQNPEKGAAANITALATVLRYVEGYRVLRKGEVVDVHKAFEDTGDPDKLIDKTLFHPTRDGYQLWADEVVKYLEPSLPG